MNNQILIGIALVLGFGGVAWWWMSSQNDEETYTLPNGVKGTADELIKQGYIPLQFGTEIKWVSKAEYEKAQTQANGNDSLLVTILNASGAILPIVGRTINTIQRNKAA